MKINQATAIKNAAPALARWLYICCGMIFIMALLGAITRLTESGLSITTWDPVSGALPPITDADWQKAFEAYQQIPQYKLLNQGMTMGEFQNIFFWEWLHRLWGRMIGFMFAIPFFYYLTRRKLDSGMSLRLAAIFALGGMQGFIGWFMVQSGLVEGTSVSPVRLALHLGCALLVYALLLWTALGLTFGAPQAYDKPKPSQLIGWIALSLLSLTIIWGAFVAGLHAGFVYNTWPSMDGSLLPDEAWAITPVWRNFIANTALVQFIHRWLGPLTGLAILIWSYQRLRTSSHFATRRWLWAMGGMVLAQITLGISTLLSQTNIILATLHQAGAITLLTLVLINLRRPDRA